MRRAKIVLMMLTAAALWGGCSHLRTNHDDDAVEQMMTMDQVPANVRAAFDKDFPGAQVKEVEKEVYPDGTVHYGFEFVTKEGKKRAVEYSAEGEQLPEH